MRIKARHCRQIELEVPVLTLNDRARKQIRDRGFPLFGD
jgi:hypothetical protein